MKMRKILCSLLSASIIAASLAVPVLANYSAGEYDVVTVDEATEQTYTDYAIAFRTSLDTTKGFYLTFDFNLKPAGKIEIPKFNNGYSKVDKVGPILKISDGKLVTETSGGTQELGACTAETWYRGEIEGRTGVGTQYTTFRLYTADGTLVQETENFNMRNLSNEGRSFTGMQITQASVKNIKLIAENPDTITVTSDANELDAGSQMTFDYSMTRKGVDTPKHDVVWSVYDASNTTELNNDAISISNSGVLSVAGTLAENTNITVRASSTFGDKTLVGTKAVSLKTVDVSGEVFDSITISGDDAVKAGSDTTYTVAATKGGNAVTPETSDVVWKVYDPTNMRENTAIEIVNGVLSVPDGTLPQSIVIRASSVSGLISTNKTVTINWSDNQKETVHTYNACETEADGVEIVDSVDGSGAYKVTGANYTIAWTNQQGYTFNEMDIQFPASGAGVLIMRRDTGKSDTEVKSDGTNIKEYGGQALAAADSDAWYHLEICYSTGDASCNIYKYNDDGTLGDRVTKLNIGKHDASEQGAIRFYTGTVIDNLKVSVPIADGLSIVAAHASMFPTEDNQITATATKKDLPITAEGIEWSVLDATDKPIIDGSVTIDGTGLMKASAMAPEGIVTVQAKTATATATVPVEIKSSEIFKMKNIGINEDGDKVVKLYVKKLLAYDDDVVFVMAFYDENKSLIEVRTLKGYGSNYTNIGEDTENEIAVDWAIPSGFDKTTGEAKVFIWTAF